jgi:glycosyltransferase involved in cell wall biosynthesis
MFASDRSVSIIIPTRNEVDNIAPLVSQIVAAAVPFHEIVFVDGHSTDGTVDVIRSLCAIHPIRLIEQDPAAPGLSAAILAGAAATKAELLVEVPIAFRNRTRGQSKMSLGIALLFFWRWSLAVCRRLLRQ